MTGAPRLNYNSLIKYSDLLLPIIILERGQ
jgi:hypothetical protein